VTSSIVSTGGLLAAGIVAGVVGTAGGITSLVSYPALLATGVSPLTANVVNQVALVACWPGSALTSRRELVGSGAWLARGLAVAAAGGAVGALLLLSTPTDVFNRVVPFLVAVGSVALLASPVLTDLRARGEVGGHQKARKLALTSAGVVSLYGGYFGAGSGVMLLALVLVLLDPRLPHANAVKNMLVGATALAAAAVYVVAGPVDWTAVAPLATGLLVGSTAGPVLARRLPERFVRWTVASLGLLLAAELWLRPG
jgi:uncharacterized membrane protein YfcA